MTLFWLDQITAWITVFLGWWIIHQTGNVKFHLAPFLMRLDVGGFTLSLAIITAARMSQIPVPFAGPLFKKFLIAMFARIILFHHRRFQKL